MTFPPMPTRRRANGFTLVELMISLALVLLLTVAMARIFGVTTRAISKGTAVGEVVRGLDATSKALQIDLSGTNTGVGYDPYNKPAGVLPLSEQPAIIISSKTYKTFLNEADAKKDSDGDPATIDRDGDGVDDAPALTNFNTGRRWFRGDRLSFFARGDFKSQAQGNAASFVTDVTSSEAWIWYGHGRVYNGKGALNDANFYAPPAAGTPGTNGTNPNNFYASQWTLLREAILLKPPVDHDGSNATADTVADDGRNPVAFAPISSVTPWRLESPRDPSTLIYNNTKTNSLASVSPLRPDNPIAYLQKSTGNLVALNDIDGFKDTPPATPGATFYSLQDARVDVAGVDSRAFRDHLSAIQESVDTTVAPSAHVLDQIYYPSTGAGGIRRTWYHQMFASESTGGGERRFLVNPQILSPLNAGETSQATSPLLPGCTGFVVEYAGDFMTQNTTDGSFINRLPDGVIDFTADTSGVYHTRWYGLPRDGDGDGLIPTAGTANFFRSIDTRPLADYTADPNDPYPFEKRLPGNISANAPSGRGSIGDYAKYSVPINGGASFTNNGKDGNYLVAWGPGDFDGTSYTAGSTYNKYSSQANGGRVVAYGPSLIRIVVTAVDNQNKLEEPITQELVFRVPAK